jgi:hypothetical protein
MLKMVLGIIGGFVVWSILWVGSDAVLMAILPGWYVKHQTEFAEALASKQPFVVDSTILLMHLVRSVIVSIISGLIAVVISRENTLTTIILGVLLLAFGLFVQLMAWSYLPLWYHIPFLALLVPMTVLGGKLKKV